MNPSGWSLRKKSGDVYPLPDSATLQRWIVEGRVTREDELSRDGEPWVKAGTLPELDPFFAVVDQARRTRAQQQAAARQDAAARIDRTEPRPGSSVRVEKSQARTPLPAADAQRAKKDTGSWEVFPRARAEADEPAWATGQASLPVDEPGAPRGPGGRDLPDRRRPESHELPERRRAAVPWVLIVLVLLAAAGAAAGAAVYFFRPDLIPAEWVAQIRRWTGSENPAPPPAAGASAPAPSGEPGTDQGTAPRPGASGPPAQSGAPGPSAPTAQGGAPPAPTPSAPGPASPDSAAVAQAPQAPTPPPPSPPSGAESPPPGAAATAPHAAQPPSRPSSPPAASAPAQESASTPEPGTTEAKRPPGGESVPGEPPRALNRAATPAPSGPAPGSAEETPAQRPTPPRVASVRPERGAAGAEPKGEPDRGQVATEKRASPRRRLQELTSEARRLRDRGRTDAALDLYGRALQLDERSADALAGRGMCYLDLSRYAPAEESFKAALAVNETHPAALMGLAETYRYEGNRSDAVTYYRKYLAAHPTGEDAAAARNAIKSLEE